MTWRRLALVLALCCGAPLVSGDAWARKPPPKPAPKRKPAANPPRKKPRPRSPSDAMKVEEDQHHERLAIIGRLKEINEESKDAELAVSIRRLDDLESRRHFLVLKLLEKASAADGEKAP